MCGATAVAALIITIPYNAPQALADDRVTFSNATFDAVTHSASVEWFPYSGASSYQLRFHYPNGSACERVVSETAVTWSAASAPCPLTKDRGRYYLEVAPIGDQLVSGFNSSRSFFVDTPKTNRSSGRAVVSVFLNSPGCELRLGEVRGEIRRGKKTITEVFWNPEAGPTADGIPSLTSCGAYTREAFRARKQDRFGIYIGGRLCTTFKGSYVLNSDNPQVSCEVGASAVPLRRPAAGADAPADGSGASLPQPSTQSPQFDTMDAFVRYLAVRGVACPGQASVGPLQRACSRSRALTIWPSPAAARKQAQSNVDLLKAVAAVPSCRFIVVGNGLISDTNDNLLLNALSDSDPTVYSCS